MDFIFKKKLGHNFYTDCYLAHTPAEPKIEYRIKVIKPQFADPTMKSYLRQQIAYMSQLNIDNLSIPELIEADDTFILKYHFDEQPTLREYLDRNKTLTAKETIELAIALCEQLEKRHQKTWVHKNVKPNNILYSSKPDNIQLFDDLAVVTQNRLSRLISDPAYRNESLPYQSPEQCGRVHLSIDYRSDLYSLGCVLYHCIAGEPPFLSDQSQDIIHSHLAETPIALEKRQSSCPSSLSGIIATLLEKQTEKRYQTVLGLKQDLLTCQQKLAHGDPSDFPLKRDDFSNEIVLPSILLGREKEQQALLGIYQNVCQGKLGVAYVSGLSGIGKSRLVQELEVPILMQQGLFAAGKYNQFSKHQPYATIAQAIGRLIRQILTETAEQLSVWKNTVLDVAGINGQLLIAVIPELSLLIGPQPEVNPLPPVEARNRFNDLFCRFMTCLATKEHPLVLFVDDLQWCDDATLDLLDQLFSAPDRHPYLLLILAFRSNEVASDHRIQHSRKSLKNSSALRLDIDLSELDKATVNEMTAYILGSSSQDTCGITNAIYPTSGGNPLLVNESLRWLHQHNGIFYDESGRWQWQEAALGKLKLPNGYLALFSEKLSRLPSDCQKILAAAALLGARFKANDLAVLLDTSHEKLLPQLSEAFAQRILIKEKTELVFGHDQIQMAAAKLNEAEQAKAIHNNIAQNLLKILQSKRQKNQEPSQDNERGQLLYSIAEHLKKSRNEQCSPDKKFEEANINFLSGEAALDSLAHSTADYYFAEAINLCDEKDWRQHYEFMLALYISHARSALLMGKQDRSNDTINIAIQHAKDDLDRADCLLAQTVATTSLGYIEEGIALGQRCCALLQNPLPTEVAAISAETAQHITELQNPQCLKRYRALPTTSDKRVLTELAVYSELLASFYVSGRSNLFFLASMRSITLALKHGKSNATTYAFGVVGSYFHLEKKYELAQQYEASLIEEVDRTPYEFGSIRAITQALWLSLHHSQSHSKLKDLCRTNIQRGIRAGELNYTGLTYIPLIWITNITTEDTQHLTDQIREGLSYCEQYDISQPLEICRAINAAFNSISKKQTPEYLDALVQTIKNWHDGQHVAALCNYYFFSAKIAYQQGNYTQAEQHLINAEPFLAGLPSTIIDRLWYVYRYLTGLQTGNNPDAEQHYKTIAEWSKYGPILQPYFALMQAEKIATTSSDVNALRNIFWQAIDSAHQHRYLFQEAHAYQRLGELMAQHNDHSSQLYLNEAVRLYKKCKSNIFAESLSNRFQLAPKHIEFEQPIPSAPLDQQLDSEFLLSATKSIMQERDYGTLSLKILSAMMARVGAKNAYLITADGETLSVLAHGRKTLSVETMSINQTIDSTENLCPEIVRFVIRTQSPVILGHASQTGEYRLNKAVQYYQLKSVLALPIIAQGRTLGLIYLENSLIPHIFNDEQISQLQVLTAQAAIALDNSLLINNLKHTQETLIQREQNLAITLNSIGDGVIVTDQMGNVSRLNPIAEKLTGWSNDEAIGQAAHTIFNVVDATTRAPRLNPIDQALSAQETVYLSNYTTLIAKDGQEYQISDSAAPIRNGDDDILGSVLVFSDVTEAYRLRKEITDSHLRLQRVMSNMHTMVTTLNPQGKILFVNKKLLLFNMLNSSDLLNQYLWESDWFSFDKDIQQQVKSACLTAAQGESTQKDLQIKTLNGPMWIEFNIHPVRDAHGKINLLVCESLDISRRKRVEQTLKNQQALQILILDNLADAVIIADDKGIIRRFNKAANQIFGYSTQEIVGKSINLLMPEEMALKHDAYLDDYYHSSRTAPLSGGQRVLAKRKNGQIFPIHISIAELSTTIDGQKRLVASAQDLTERELQQEMLQRSQKMEALGNLTGGIAHDYNNVLGVILGYSELLEPKFPDGSKEKGFLKQIQHATERGAALTQKLLSYSQQKASHSDEINVNKFLESQQEMLEKTLTVRVQLSLKLDKKTRIINANEGDLEDAMLNLCINAMHAMPDGGHLTLAVRSQTMFDQDAAIVQIERGEYVVISVIDTGIGMDKAIQAKIFDPFFSTKGEMGTGLGLSQVYGFMERSRGAIKVYSEPGHGSRFSLYFPAESAQSKENTGENHTESVEDLSGTASILIVDDEPALLDLIKEALQKQGYTIFCAENANNAMNIIKKESIHLVLSDIIMPDINGYQLAKNIHQYDPDIIVQLMSGFDGAYDFNDDYQSLHSTLLTKPIKTQVLLKVVKQLLNTN